MIVDKNGAVKALKEAYKKGYEVSQDREIITICAAAWTIRAMTRQLPVEVAQTIVEHLGYLPTSAERVQKGTANQSVMPETMEWRTRRIQDVVESAVYMSKIPVIFKDKWQLYRTDKGVHAFDTALLAMVSEDAMAAQYVTPEGIGLWRIGEEAIYIAQGKFDLEDQKKLRAIAELYENPQVVPCDMPENLCIFDDIEEEME